MLALSCTCGQRLYPENTRCLNCRRALGLDCQVPRMVSYIDEGEVVTGDDGVAYRLCENRARHRACNGLVRADSGDRLCFPCGLNRTIPNLSNPANRRRWRRLEQAKRRLICGLTQLRLPGIGDMRFDFLADKRSHPDAIETFVMTGHQQGVITINILEADDVQRMYQQELSSERYRTLLGHLRHEAGHYFYLQLNADSPAFRERFGDPTLDYEAALQRHYDQGPPTGWEQEYISAYASSHAMEDWAECFAHYLHIRDGLDTATAFGFAAPGDGDFDNTLRNWSELVVGLNEVSHALGLGDAYPFVLTLPVQAKLAFIHELVEHAAAT